MYHDIKPTVQGGRVIGIPSFTTQNAPEQQALGGLVLEQKVRVVTQKTNAIAPSANQVGQVENPTRQAFEEQMPDQKPRVIIQNISAPIPTVRAPSQPQVTEYVNQMEQARNLNVPRQQVCSQEEFLNQPVTLKHMSQMFFLMGATLGGRPEVDNLTNIIKELDDLKAKMAEETSKLREELTKQEQIIKEQIDLTKQLKEQGKETADLHNQMRTTIGQYVTPSAQTPGTLVLPYFDSPMPLLPQTPGRIQVPGENIANSLIIPRARSRTVVNLECPFCQGFDHTPINCPKHRTVSGRKNIARRKGLCSTCLKLHEPPCNERVPCLKCNKQSHHISLCGDVSRPVRRSAPRTYAI